MKRRNSLYNVMTKGLFNLKMDVKIREEFKLAAALRGATMSSLVHQYAFQIIREERDECPAAFVYLQAGGSAEAAIKIGREFGKRSLSDDDIANIRRIAEAENAPEELQIVSPEFPLPVGENPIPSEPPTEFPADQPPQRLTGTAYIKEKGGRK